MEARALVAACVIALAPLPGLAQDGPPQEVFPPPGAKGKDRPVQLVVYPDADHSFDDYGGRTYRAADTEDAWRRTQEMLAKHHPVK